MNYLYHLTFIGYWIASRGTWYFTDSDGTTSTLFCVYYIGYDIFDDNGSQGITLTEDWQYISLNSSSKLPRSLFPIVTVPANLIVPDGENFKVE